ncbi:MAG: hypothetical protein IKT32_03810 [Clostridia bacterium]|nr:hypothetical protein [Clostridia bacterium]
MFQFLPKEINEYISSRFNQVYELRIRKNKSCAVNILGQFKPLIIGGKEVICDQNCIDKIIANATNNSLYKFNEELKKGYISYKGGIRIGVAGECVVENGSIKTIKNFSSLCIRFPHEIKGCAEKAFEIIRHKESVKSLLVISPPGVGKTTLLRDLTRIISNIKNSNILVVDEKNEIFYERFDLGNSTDILSSCTKEFGFFTAVKTLSPDIIIADELTSESDANGVLFANLSGVKTICSVHGNSLESVMKKDYMKKLFLNRCFEKYILLKKTNSGFETIEVFS